MIAQPNGQGGALAPKAGTQGGVGGPSASAPGGSPKRQVRPMNPNTFAGMQQQGVARPSPSMVQQNPYAIAGTNPALNAAAAPAQASVQPTAQSAIQSAQQSVGNAQAGRNLGTYQTSPMAQSLGAPLMQQVMTMLQDPTQGLNEAAASNFDRQNRTLGREFDTLRETTNENMAARGLDASTIASGKLGELGARQAEAQADVSARVQEQLIRDRAAATQAAINSAIGLRGQEAEMAKDEFTINRDTGQLEFQRGMDEKRFGLDQTVGLGNLEINRGNLDLSRDRFGFDKFRDGRDFTYRSEQDAIDNSLDQSKFDFTKSTDARDFGYRQERDVIGDGQVDRAFNYGKDRDTKNDTYRDNRDKVTDGQWNQTFDYGKNRDTKNDEYRSGRDKVTDSQWDKSYNQNDRNITTQGIGSILNGLGYKNIPPALMSSILSALGLGGGGGSAGGGGGGGGGGNGGGGGFSTDDGGF